MGSTLKTANTIKNPSSSEMMLRLYVCYTCGERFISNCSLKEHMDIHANEKQFKCEICLKTFQRKSSLNRHKMIHERNQHFVCDKCGHGYSRKDNLKKHLKGYSCTECEKTFCGKLDLKKHIREQHVFQPEVACSNPYTDQTKHYKRSNALNIFSTTTFDCSEDFNQDIFAFMNSLRGSIETELKYQLIEKTCFKWSLRTEVIIQPLLHNGITESLCLDSNTMLIFSENEINDCIDRAFDEIMIAYEQYIEFEIFRTFERVVKLNVLTATYNPQ